MTTPSPTARLVALSRWIDEHPPNRVRSREAQLWGRVAKVAEECGEAVAAVIACTGQNPRKPATGDLAAVVDELLDVAVTALAAVEHVDQHQGRALDLLERKLATVTIRAGLEVEDA